MVWHRIYTPKIYHIRTSLIINTLHETGLSLSTSRSPVSTHDLRLHRNGVPQHLPPLLLLQSSGSSGTLPRYGPPPAMLGVTGHQHCHSAYRVSVVHENQMAEAQEPNMSVFSWHTALTTSSSMPCDHVTAKNFLPIKYRNARKSMSTLIVWKVPALLRSHYFGVH